MRHLLIREGEGSPTQVARKLRARVMVALLGVTLLAIALAACGGTAQGRPQQARTGATPTSTPTPTLTPSATPAPSPTTAPTSSPTPQPQPAPTAVPAPPQPPLAPILDVRPSSMSIVGHLDCTRTTAYVCQAAVIAEASNQRALRWVASTSVPGGHIGFSPASGVLAPGQRVLVTITVPFTDCASGLFIFQGPANTHTISWAC